MRTKHVRLIERRSKAKRSLRFRLLGLNTLGRPYQRTPNLPPEKRADNLRLIYRRHKQKRAAQFRSLGLTTRGTAYKYLGRSNRRKFVVPVSADHRSIIELEINAVLNELNLLYQWLPARAQAAAVRLAHSVGYLKQRIKEI